MSPLPLAISGVSGAVLGFAAAALWLGRAEAPPRSEPLALRPSSEGDALAPNTGAAPSFVEEKHIEASGSANKGTAGKAGAAEASSAERVARANELRELRAKEQAVRDQLSAARRRMAELEKELQSERPEPGPKRTRREFDLTPEDWREMAAKGTMKYRLPCDGPPPTGAALDALGLAPDDHEVVQQAFGHSEQRLRSAVAPLCAAALGGREEVALEMSTEACRNVILSTVADRSESKAQSAKSVATFMAGDAPRPGESAPLSERLYLALAEEAKLIESELASSFGPEEAHRIIFSDQLCFQTATFNFQSPGR